jgi:hypothetical protein
MATHYVSSRKYVNEILKTARYEAGGELDCVVAVKEYPVRVNEPLP